MDIKQFIRIKLISEQSEDLASATLLAQEIGLPSPSFHPEDVPLYLSYHNGRLILFDSSNPKSELSVDFLSGTLRYRYFRDRKINQDLAKAVGIKRGIRPTICDATAGFGTDSFVFASLGCKVLMIERSPVIWALLRDGLRRAANDKLIGEFISEKITLLQGDAKDLLKDQDKKYDTVYIDPMYPEMKKSARSKQKMVLLRSVVGIDQDQTELFDTSRAYATRRVVVKRPASAPPISDLPVSYQVKGKSSRYDIYLSPHL